MLATIDFKEAAKLTRFPEAALREAADYHGITIVIGRSARILPSDLGELLNKCRVKPKGQDCIGENERTGHQFGKSETRGLRQSRPAQTAAAKLKSSSKPILSTSTGDLVRFPLKK